MNANGSVTNARKTTTMIAAALVIVPAVIAMPARDGAIASPGRGRGPP